MTDDGGWIKVHRKLLDWPLLKNGSAIRLWLYILLRANHADCDVLAGGKTLHLRAGELIIGRDKTSQDTGLSPKQVRTGLVSLVRHACIKTVRTEGQPFTIVTVANWQSYQGRGQLKGQPKGQPRASQGPQTRM